MFFYNKIKPFVNDYVAIQIKEIKESGCVCQLIEYDNLICYLNINDITTEKIKKIQDLKKHISLNSIEILEIKEIDENDNVFLNRKYLDESSVKTKFNQYQSYNKIYNYVQNQKKIESNIKNDILNELKSENIENIINKYDFLSDIFLKQTESYTDNFTFVLNDYINVYYLKQHLNEIKKELDIKEITISNSKNGIFSIKTKNQYKTDYLQNIENYLKQKNFFEGIDVDIEINETFDNEQPLLNIGIIGHVSHGKTTLIKRLTNVDTKKYKKELETNKTLKLGYTNAYITKCSCSNKILYLSKKCKNLNNTCDSKLISIVDCPGHNILMNTMLCGTSIMDTSIIMIASNETCPQPQTLDHILAITINNKNENYFDNSLIVLNKCDLISKDDALKKHTEIKEFIKDTIIENSCIIPTSAQKNINLEKVSEWMYKYVSKRDTKTNFDSDFFKSLIVRTFDINKPGTLIDNISGLVLGSSILTGNLKVGDEIIILPEGIKTKVYELYTDKVKLNKAKKGGLIGVKTDISPSYADMFIGSFFIKLSDYKKELHYDYNMQFELNYFIRKDNNYKKVFKEKETIDINIEGKYIKNCKIKTIDKNKKKCIIEIPYKTYRQDKIKISFLKNNNLIGYGTHDGIHDGIHDETQNKNLDLDFSINFSETLNDFYYKFEELEKTFMKNIPKLPNPIIKFSNHVSTFYNFIDISNLIDSNHIFLGNYIMNEFGLKSMSINETQLILRGKVDETKIENILVKYLQENKLCNNCYSYDTFVQKIQNCKVITCKKCDYSIKK